MTREEAIAIFNGFKFLPREMEAVDMAIKALEQEPCEDAVSRTKAMEICKSRGHDNSAHYISELPPVTPKRKHGEWERETFDLGENLPVRVAYQCSECGNYFDSEFNFCPHCGSNMKGGEE